MLFSFAPATRESAGTDACGSSRSSRHSKTPEKLPNTRRNGRRPTRRRTGSMGETSCGRSHESAGRANRPATAKPAKCFPARTGRLHHHRHSSDHVSESRIGICTTYRHTRTDSRLARCSSAHRAKILFRSNSARRCHSCSGIKLSQVLIEEMVERAETLRSHHGGRIRINVIRIKKL